MLQPWLQFLQLKVATVAIKIATMVATSATKVQFTFSTLPFTFFYDVFFFYLLLQLFFTDLIMTPQGNIYLLLSISVELVVRFRIIIAKIIPIGGRIGAGIGDATRVNNSSSHISTHRLADKFDFFDRAKFLVHTQKKSLHFSDSYLRLMDKLQWGSRRRLRCVKVKESSSASSVMYGGGAKSEEETGGDSGGNAHIVKKKITSRVDAGVEKIHHINDIRNDSTTAATKHVQASCPCPLFQSPNRLNKDIGSNRSSVSENRRMLTYTSPEKADRFYTTRGSGLGILDDNNKMFMEATKESKAVVWPKLYVALSSKEKEEDFMAMKGCKLPQRPKKRAKIIQKSVLFVSPGQWLSDLCQERYEVREKKTSKKRPRGLKAMGSIETDSD